MLQKKKLQKPLPKATRKNGTTKKRTDGKNSSKIAYGPKETQNAINLGAVSELLVLDTKVAGENMGDLMDMVENMKGEVMVISSEHEGGKQLESLGGMAAILRYEIV